MEIQYLIYKQINMNGTEQETWHIARTDGRLDEVTSVHRTYAAAVFHIGEAIANMAQAVAYRLVNDNMQQGRERDYEQFNPGTEEQPEEQE